MTRALVASLAVALVAAANAGGVRGGFSANVTNEFFPLPRGRTLIYVGSKDGKAARDVFHVTRRTAIIEGAACTVVDDRLYLDGRLEERTTDWYAQAASGTVWYFGERTAELDRHGRVTSTEGSWRAGENGARPGVFMPAHPRVGQSFAQEHAKGVAEDRFRVVAVQPAGPKATVETREWTPLEPGVVDRKRYVRGYGTDVEETVKGGDEHLELIAVH